MVKGWLVAAVLAISLASCGLAAAATVAGDWAAEIVSAQGEPQFAHVVLKIAGTKVTGTWGRRPSKAQSRATSLMRSRRMRTARLKDHSLERLPTIK